MKRRYKREKKSTKYISRLDFVQAFKRYGMFHGSFFRIRLENQKVERAHFKGGR